MKLPVRDSFKGGVAVVLALLVCFLGVRSVRAANTANTANTDPPGVPGQATDNERPPADDSAGDGTSARPSSGPQLQLQDDPAERDSDRAHRARVRAAAAAEEVEERPFWKSWIFWTITGVLVAGVVGMAIYTSSGTNSSLAPCPPDVVVSLGCFGTGR